MSSASTAPNDRMTPLEMDPPRRLSLDPKPRHVALRVCTRTSRTPEAIGTSHPHHRKQLMMSQTRQSLTTTSRCATAQTRNINQEHGLRSLHRFSLLLVRLYFHPRNLSLCNCFALRTASIRYRRTCNLRIIDCCLFQHSGPRTIHRTHRLSTPLLSPHHSPPHSNHQQSSPWYRSQYPLLVALVGPTCRRYRRSRWGGTVHLLVVPFPHQGDALATFAPLTSQRSESLHPRSRSHMCHIRDFLADEGPRYSKRRSATLSRLLWNLSAGVEARGCR